MKAAGDKIKKLREVLGIARAAKRSGKTVVTTNGCFDLIHVGHVRNLENAKKMGDVLIVGVNSDRSARLNKGGERPIIKARERAEVIAALAPVDCVFIFAEKTPDLWLAKIKPHIHAKGGDRKIGEIVERETVKRCGGRVVLLPRVKNRSTSKIIEIIGDKIFGGSRRKAGSRAGKLRRRTNQKTGK